MYLQVIGCGDAFASGGRDHPCFLLQGESGTLLLDCGASSLSALKRQGVLPSSIDAVVISHFHGDHFGGVPFLLLDARFGDGRRRPLRVAGPPGVEERVTELSRALYRSGAAMPDPSFVTFQDLEPGSSHRVGPASIQAFAARHDPRETCLGLRVELDGKIVVYTGDTRWLPTIEERSRGADLLISECTNIGDDRGAHTSLEDILAQRDRLGCRRLLLVHLGAGVLAARDEHRELPWAEDGMRIEL